jgi:zinc D-Ala-D-Ala dipeptidase
MCLAAGAVARCLCALAMLLPAVPAAAQQPLPATMVYLRDIDPTIIQEMRYATVNNFTGRHVPGYEAGECILQKQVALALSKAQSALKERRMSLKVYDCYRPQRAVEAFVLWANGKSENSPSDRFHPRVPSRQLLARGYIAAKSNHSRGVAVDAALVRLPPAETEAFDPARAYGNCTEPKEKRAPDSSIDFGTDFDCFDERSHTNSKSLSTEQTTARMMFVALMAEYGFVNYHREWWHFTFANAAAGRSYDFPVQSREGASRN